MILCIYICTIIYAYRIIHIQIHVVMVKPPFFLKKNTGWQLSAQAHHPTPKADREVGAPVGVARFSPFEVRIRHGDFMGIFMGIGFKWDEKKDFRSTLYSYIYIYI